VERHEEEERGKVVLGDRNNKKKYNFQTSIDEEFLSLFAN